LLDAAKFDEVQRLLSANAHSGHNGSQPVRHSYPLSPGLLHCGRCAGPMEARSGTGRLGVTYYYYVCRDKDCGMRINAEEVEGVVLDRLSHLAKTKRCLGVSRPRQMLACNGRARS